MVADMKREKFIKLAQARTANALRSIRVIGNLSNKAHYDYSEADVRKIMSALGKEVDAMGRRFADAPSKANVEFKL